MAQRYGSNHKLCATCAYWTGARESVSFAGQVTNCEGYGKCEIPNGPLKNSQRLGNACACLDWKKWPVLK